MVIEVMPLKVFSSITSDQEKQPILTLQESKAENIFPFTFISLTKALQMNSLFDQLINELINHLFNN